MSEANKINAAFPDVGDLPDADDYRDAEERAAYGGDKTGGAVADVGDHCDHDDRPGHMSQIQPT